MSKNKAHKLKQCCHLAGTPHITGGGGRKAVTLWFNKFFFSSTTKYVCLKISCDPSIWRLKSELLHLKCQKKSLVTLKYNGHSIMSYQCHTAVTNLRHTYDQSFPSKGCFFCFFFYCFTARVQFLWSWFFVCRDLLKKKLVFSRQPSSPFFLGLSKHGFFCRFFKSLSVVSVDSSIYKLPTCHPNGLASREAKKREPPLEQSSPPPVPRRAWTAEERSSPPPPPSQPTNSL